MSNAFESLVFGECDRIGCIESTRRVIILSPLGDTVEKRLCSHCLAELQKWAHYWRRCASPEHVAALTLYFMEEPDYKDKPVDRIIDEWREEAIELEFDRLTGVAP